VIDFTTTVTQLTHIQSVMLFVRLIRLEKSEEKSCFIAPITHHVDPIPRMNTTTEYTVECRISCVCIHRAVLVGVLFAYQ
jgi:hypothetical protein